MKRSGVSQLRVKFGSTRVRNFALPRLSKIWAFTVKTVFECHFSAIVLGLILRRGGREVIRLVYTREPTIDELENCTENGRKHEVLLNRR